MYMYVYLSFSPLLSFTYFVYFLLSHSKKQLDVCYPYKRQVYFIISAVGMMYITAQVGVLTVMVL